MASRVKGLDSLNRKLKAIPDEVKPELRKALAEGGEEVVSLQKRLVPRRTGRLRDSIQWRFGNEAPVAYSNMKSGGPRGDPETTIVISAGDAEARHAHLVEFGTAPHPQGGMFAGTEHPGTPPRPYFFPAFRAKRRIVKAKIGRAMSKAAKKVAAR